MSDERFAIPPEPGDQAADPVTDGVAPVSDRRVDEFWSPPFKQDGPEDEVRADFPKRRWRVRPPMTPPMEPEHERQCARDEPEIIEIAVQKSVPKMRFENASVE